MEQERVLDYGPAQDEQPLPTDILMDEPSFEERKMARDAAHARNAEFWENNPDLKREAEELGAPMDSAEEFKRQGYGFLKNEANEAHILAPTPEFKQHLENPAEYPRPRGQIREDIFDRNRRLERQRRQEIEARIDALVSEDYVNSVAERLFPDKEFSASKKQELSGQVAKLITEYSFKREDKLGDDNFVAGQYGRAFEKSIANDSLDITSEMVESAVYDKFDSEEFRVKNRTTDWSYYKGGYNFKYKYEAPIIAQEILREKQRELFGENIRQSLEKLPEDLKQEARRKAIINTIHHGEFLPQTIADNPSEADKVLEEMGIDKTDGIITQQALCGYFNAKVKENIANYFDLEERIAEMIDNPENQYYYNGDYVTLNGLEVPDEISSGVVEKIQQKIKTISESLKQKPKFMEVVDREYRSLAEKKENEIAREMARRPYGFDFGKYIDMKNLNCRPDELSTACFLIEQKEKSISPGCILEEVIGTKDINVDVDGAGIMKKTLEKFLYEGVDEEYFSDYEYLTTIFRMGNFDEYRERLGINFEDPRIFALSFNGFINTLAEKNGGKSEQADWYYENVFAKHPEVFLKTLKGYRESEKCSKGMKGKITKFLKNNEGIFEYQKQRELEEKIAREANGKRGVITASLLRDATREDIQHLINKRQRELVEKIEALGAEKIMTFRESREREGNGGEADMGEAEARERVEAPVDFGVEKIKALMKYYNFIKYNVPNSNPHWFIDTFPEEEKAEAGSNERFGDVKLDSTRSYMGFRFEYEGSQCVIAESFGDPAGMYLYRGELDSDFKEMLFDMPKYDAMKGPNVAVVRHLDKAHFDEDLDTSYKKAFMFFRTGDKDVLSLTKVGGRENFEAMQATEFPAWPMSVNNDFESFSEDIERYDEWQAGQFGANEAV